MAREIKETETARFVEPECCVESTRQRSPEFAEMIYPDAGPCFGEISCYAPENDKVVHFCERHHSLVGCGFEALRRSFLGLGLEPSDVDSPVLGQMINRHKERILKILNRKQRTKTTKNYPIVEPEQHEDTDALIEAHRTAPNEKARAQIDRYIRRLNKEQPSRTVQLMKYLIEGYRQPSGGAPASRAQEANDIFEEIMGADQPTAPTTPTSAPSPPPPSSSTTRTAPPTPPPASPTPPPTPPSNGTDVDQW